MHRLTHLSLRHPGATLLVLGLVTLALGAGLPRVRAEFGYRVLLGEDHPTIRTLDEFIAEFGGGLPLTVVWPCGADQPCESALDGASLAMASALTREIEPLADVRAVSGPANAPLLVAAADGFDVRQLVIDGARVPDADVLAALAVEDPFWRGTLVSSDGRVGAIAIQTFDNEADTLLRTFDAVEAALDPFRRRGFDFYLTGEAPATVVPGRDLARSSARLVPITVVVIALVLFWLSRSWQHALIGLVTMATALVWTLGLLGWLGWPRDGILEVLAPLIMVVGVCDAIHLLAGGTAARGPDGTARQQSFVDTARVMSAPCVLTTLTTAVAFGSFVTSPLVTFIRFGVISAFGVCACLVLTFSLLPVLGARLPAVEGSQDPRWIATLHSVLGTARRHARPALLCSVAVLLVCGLGWPRLRVDTDWLESLGEASPRVQWVRFAEEHLGPSDTLEVELSLPEGTSLEEPQTIATLDAFSHGLEGIAGFGQARSVVDVISRVNRMLHAGDPAFDRPGRTARENAELIELVALQGSDLLRPWMSLDRRRLRVSASAAEISYAERDANQRRVEQLVDTLLPDDWNVRFSGEYTTELEWVHDVQTTQLRSFPTAFALVFLMLALFLRSFWLAVAGMVPTLLAVVATLGTMGWLGMSLDVGRAMIAAVVIGIAVDDAIHLLYAYRQRRRAGWAPGAAMEDALLRVGRAVVTTSLALALGFLTLMASAWQTIASFGFAVALAILAALLATLGVLPVLVHASEWLAATVRDVRVHRNSDVRGPPCTG